MIIITAIIAFGLGAFLTHTAHKDTIKCLEKENSEIRSNAATKLTSAYDRIEQLEERVKLLTKELNKK